MNETPGVRSYLLVSDFDQTLSFNDSGLALSELLGLTGFERKVAGLARINLVQQGGELAYLLLHDPEYRRVRREHLVETGKRIRLKYNLPRLVEILERGIEGYQFALYVISAAPRNDSLPRVPLPRFVGAWTYPMVNGIFHGAQPEFVDLVVHEQDGHADGTLYGRFKTPPGSATELDLDPPEAAEDALAALLAARGLPHPTN